MTTHAPLAQLQQLAALPGTCAAAGQDRQRVETRAGRAIDPRVIPAQRAKPKTAPGEDPRRRAWAAIDRAETLLPDPPSFFLSLDLAEGTVRDFRLRSGACGGFIVRGRAIEELGLDPTEVSGVVFAAPLEDRNQDYESLWQGKPRSSEEDMREALLQHVAKDIAAPLRAGCTPSPRAYAIARAVLQMEDKLGLSPDLARRLKR